MDIKKYENELNDIIKDNIWCLYDELWILIKNTEINEKKELEKRIQILKENLNICKNLDLNKYSYLEKEINNIFNYFIKRFNKFKQDVYQIIIIEK